MAAVTGMVPLEFAVGTGSGPLQTMHNAMGTISDYFAAVGLQPVVLASTYKLAGPTSQIPTSTSTPASPWLIWTFTDDYQDVLPIYVGIRCVVNRWGSTQAWGFQLAVSDAIDEAGATFTGRTVTTADPVNTASTSSSIMWGVSLNMQNKGDFVRYTGDSLSVLIGVDSRDNGNSQLFRPVTMMHVERMRDKSGAVEPGFHAVADDYPYPASSGSTLAAVHSTEPGAVRRSNQAPCRAGAADGLYENGVPVVAPVFGWSSRTMGIVPLKRLFSVPTAPFPGGGSMLRLDFSGMEKPYLLEVARKQYPQLSSCGWLFEWE